MNHTVCYFILFHFIIYFINITIIPLLHAQPAVPQELRDVDLQLQLVKDLDPRFSVARLRISDPAAETNGAGPTAPRRPTTTSSYAHAKRQHGLDDVIAATILTGEQLAENVQVGSKVHVPRDPETAPAEMLPDYVDVQVCVGDGCCVFP